MGKLLLIWILVLMATKFLEGKQELVLNKNGILFKLELLSASELSFGDSVKVKYTVKNTSPNQIVILAIDIPGKKYWEVMKVNNELEIELDLGGNLLAKMGMIRKFKVLEKGSHFSSIFALPISKYIATYQLWRKGKKLKGGVKYLKDVQITASVAYSDSEEFFEGDLKKATQFDDYWGVLKNWSGSGIELYTEMFNLSGITIRINLLE